MAALSPLAVASTNGTPEPTGLAPSPVPAPPLNPPQVARAQLVVVNGRLVVAGSDAEAAAQAPPLANATQTTDANPKADAPDSEKSLAQAVASENGPSAAPPPPSRAELEAQLAEISAQVSNASPGAPESTGLELKEAQIRQALAELTIAPGSYGTARPELRGLATDKVA